MRGVDWWRAAEAMFDQLGKKHLSPWRQREVFLFAAGNDLWGMKYTKLGWPMQSGVMVDYVWNPVTEIFPGAELTAMLERRVPPSEPQDPVTATVLDTASAKAMPTLHAFLTQQRWPDGSERETGTLNVWYDGTSYRAMLRDRDQGLVLFITCPVLSKLLSVCDGAAAAKDADWRKDKQASPRGRKKK